ncbi:chemotaxis protein CheW [Chondromyces apiculatus]|uniref:CheW protein n=1 Tax=Chondromyces apiculatus DSM 436 TaxID=1192034 RepID=A0A017T5W7_9BACT|nr:chemotaxis protein CheW [Chondromyces apiculatus]EYF04589.1 CheW protein [Chondromyces apiculatus DSM 436]
MLELLTFALDEFRYAVPSTRVVEVIQRVLITPLPGTAAHVLGLIAHRGGMAVAVDLRARFGLPPRRPTLDDHLVVARGARRQVALVVDRAEGLLMLPRAQVEDPPLAVTHVSGIAMLEGGLLLIHDLDAALSLDDERAIDAGIAEVEARA